MDANDTDQFYASGNVEILFNSVNVEWQKHSQYENVRPENPGMIK